MKLQGTQRGQRHRRAPARISTPREDPIAGLSAPGSQERLVLRVRKPDFLRDGPETWKSISVKGRAGTAAYLRYLLQFQISRLRTFSLPVSHELVNEAARGLADVYARAGVSSLPVVHGPFRARDRKTNGLCLSTSRSFAMLSPYARKVLLDNARGFSQKGMFDRKAAAEIIDLMNLTHEITHGLRYIETTERGDLSWTGTADRWRPGTSTFRVLEEAACCINEEAIVCSRGWMRRNRERSCSLTTGKNIGRRMHEVFCRIYGKDGCKLERPAWWNFWSVKLSIPSERILFTKNGTSIEMGYDHVVRCLEKLAMNAEYTPDRETVKRFKDALRMAHVTGNTGPLLEHITAAYGDSARKFLAWCPPQGQVYSMLITAFGDSSRLPARHRNKIYDELLDILLEAKERGRMTPRRIILNAIWKWLREN